MIIGISGKAQSGKDTTGAYLNAMLQGKKCAGGISWFQGSSIKPPYEIKKFAGKLKSSMEFKFPNLFNEQLWEAGDSSYREEWLELLQMTRRDLLIREAMALREICPDYWIIALLNEYTQQTLSWDNEGNSTKDDFPNWIITDLRFPNEFEAIRKAGGICIRVEREDIPLIDSVSETSLDEGFHFDFYINNNTSKTDLIKKIEQLYKSIK